MFVFLEFGVVAALVLIALGLPKLGSSRFRKLEGAFAPIIRRRWLAVVVVTVLPVVVRLALLPFLPVPVPGGHDEFSYLLAADTFAHGRLANPTHPMWIHFESPHILQQPTYASMYFPAQGLILAAGQVIFGSPWAGVLISVGVMCGAICWMLQGWLPARWALLGGLIAVMRLGIFSYWANSYWGGAAAATGGALVLGALPRIKRRQHVRDALLMAIGLVILANSRPYEGLIFSLPAGVVLLAWMLGKKGPSLKVSVRRVVLPVVLVLVPAAAAMGYYYWRVTGNPFLMPEQLNVDTYHMDRLFFGQMPRPEPEYHHKALRDYFFTELATFGRAQSASGVITLTWAKLVWIWFFFLGPALTLPVLAMMALVPYGYSWSQISSRFRFLLCAFGVMMAGLAPEVYFSDHYAAPMTGLMIALVMQSMRYIRLWKWDGKRNGLFLMRAVPMTCIAMLLFRVVAQPFHLPVTPMYPQTWCCADPGNLARARSLQQLTRLKGRQLVIVRYKPNHDVHDEWVYNEADIDSAKVSWAREMDEAHNRELIRYFKDRCVWLLEADERPPKLSAYPFPTSP